MVKRNFVEKSMEKDLKLGQNTRIWTLEGTISIFYFRLLIIHKKPVILF